MDCHNAHHIVILACGIGLSVVYLVFLLYIYVPDKVKQPLVAGLFIGCGHLNQHIYILSAPFSCRHSRCIPVKASLIKHHVQKLMDWRISYSTSEPLKYQSEGFKLLVLIAILTCHGAKCSLCKAYALKGRPDLCQLLIIHAHDRRSKHCCHRNILQRIIEYAKHGQNHLYFIR